MDPLSLRTAFLSEFVGTALLLLLGCGVVANVALARTKGHGSGFLLVNLGWGMSVFASVYVAHRSGAHLNPAITLGLLVHRAREYAPGVAVTPASTLVYFAAQLAGAFVGAVGAWLAYRAHFDETEDPEALRAVFCTSPAIRRYGWNVLTEVIATFVLVFVVLEFGHTPSGLGPLAAALLVVGVGNCLGGPTGYAINPARDLGPRLAHAALPIRAKGPSDWRYAWVPVLGPLAGGALAGLASTLYN